MLLYFFEGRSFVEVGEMLAVTPDAARMRVNRAIDRVRTGFARRGIASTAAALGAVLTTQSAAAAPAGLASAVVQQALQQNKALNQTQKEQIQKMAQSLQQAQQQLGKMSQQMNKMAGQCKNPGGQDGQNPGQSQGQNGQQNQNGQQQAQQGQQGQQGQNSQQNQQTAQSGQGGEQGSARIARFQLRVPSDDDIGPPHADRSHQVLLDLFDGAAVAGSIQRGQQFGRRVGQVGRR